MRTISQFVFRFVTIRFRITATALVLSLLLGFALSGVGWIAKVKGAPNSPLAAVSGFLYVLNDCRGCRNRIFGFAVDETTGVLTPLTDGFPVSTGGDGSDGFSSDLLTIDRENLRLFAINNGTKTVSAFTIDPETGALTAMFSPIFLNGTGSFNTVAAHPRDDNTLLVIGRISPNSVGGSLVSFRITPTAATPVSNESTGEARPLYTVFRQDGSFVYTGGGGPVSKFAGFSINSSGTLSILNPAGFESKGADPRGYAMDAQGRLFMANRTSFGPQQLRVFTTTNGMPTLVSNDAIVTPVREVGRGVMHPGGNFYLVSDRSINVDLVAVYRFNSSNSTTPFTAVFGSPFHSGGTAVKLLAFNKAGRFLFAGNQDTFNLTTFRIDSATGVLTRVVTQAPKTVGGSGSLNGIAYGSPFTTTTTIFAPTVTRKSVPGEIAHVIIIVTSTHGTFSGNVSLKVDGGTAITKALSGGAADFDLVMPRVGAHTLRATFGGSGLFASSVANNTLTVKKAPPMVVKP